MFSKIKSCPFCGSKKLEVLNNTHLSTNFYIQEIISDLKISFNLLKRKLKKKNAEYVTQFSFQLGLMIFLRKNFFINLWPT